MRTRFQPRPQSELFAALEGKQFQHTMAGRVGTYTIFIEGGCHVVTDRLRGSSVMPDCRAMAKTSDHEGRQSQFDLASQPELFVRLCNDLAGGYYRDEEAK